MKRLTALFLILFTALVIGFQSMAQELVPYLYPFTGRWQPSEDALLIDDYGLQDIQNLRKDGKHFKGVNGHTAINSSAPSTNYTYLLNGFHFKKDQPSESHVIVYAANSSTPTAGALYQHTTAVPGTGNFTSTALWSPTYYNNIWRFSSAPSGNMVAANGDETLIWGGNEIEATSFITSSQTVTYTVTNSNDYSDILNNTRQSTDQVATLYYAGGIDAYAKLMLHFNGTDMSTTFTDETGKSMTAVGDSRIDIYSSKFGGASGYFDGTGDYLTAVDSDDWEFMNSDFTVDFWVKFDGVTDAGFVGQYVNASNFWGLSYNNSTHKLILYGYDNSALRVHYDVDWTPTTLTWYHVAVVRTGTTCKIFINGTSQTVNITQAWNSPGNLAATLAVGFYPDATRYLKGWMDELRISKGIARWTSSFTPPTQPYGNSSNYFLIGSKRPLQGTKFYISSGNTVSSTLDVKEWQGTTWTTLSATDNTSSGGKTLAQTGTVTWTATGNAKPRYINGLSLYWYQFFFDAGQASIYYVTTDAPMQTMKNIWDGVEEYTVKCLKYDGTTYKDYTNQVNDGSSSTYADFSSLGTSHAIYLGFLNPMQGINIQFVAGSENSTSSTAASIYFWNGNDWQSVVAGNDGTATSTTSFSKGGVVSFQGANKGTEFKRAISDEYPLFYYKIQFAGTLDADTKVSEITGIAYPNDLPTFSFSETFQNRLFLFNEKSGDRNKCIYSAYNSPDLMNGDDSGEITFGDRNELIAAAVIYNIYTNTAVEQMLVTKRNETWRLSGSSPENWVLQKMSTNIGCVAPLSMVSAEMTESAEVKRTVAIWQSDKGVVMSDGATVVPISDDIKCYWDPNDSRYIPTALQSKSVGWYDSSTRSYKLLIASGSTATYLNTELEYSLKYKEWTKVYRENASGANPLQSAFKVWDTNGVGYTYGGGKDGFMYRLENGNNWNGVANITSYLHTKDMILDTQAPMMRKATVKYMRTAYKKKDVGNITITHYGDRAITTSGTSGQIGPSIIANASTTHYDTQATNLGPWLYHSLKYSATTNVADGLELLSTGIYYAPQTTIRQ